MKVTLNYKDNTIVLNDEETFSAEIGIKNLDAIEKLLLELFNMINPEGLLFEAILDDGTLENLGEW